MKLLDSATVRGFCDADNEETDDDSKRSKSEMETPEVIFVLFIVTTLIRSFNGAQLRVIKYI